jgi:DNA topoisomerase-2
MTDNPEEEYTRLDDREHVLKRPDTYVGPIEPEPRVMNMISIADDSTFKVSEGEVSYIAGLERIMLEILSNAADNATKSRTMGIDPGKLVMTVTDTTVTIYNEGRPVSTVYHNKEKEWIPTMIFFRLRAGSNFDDTKEKKYAGRNGFGAKLAAIFSTHYSVRCRNVTEGIEHYQEAHDNLTIVDPPVRTPIEKKGTSSTEVSFSPDFKIFYTKIGDQNIHSQGEPLTNDPLHCRLCWDANNGYKTHAKFSKETVEMFASSALDFSFNCSVSIDFHWRSESLGINRSTVFDARSMMEYVKCYFPEVVNIKSEPIVFESESTRMIMFDTPHNGFQKSFANGMPTRDGGVHVTTWLNEISSKLKAELATKEVSITATNIKPHVTIFLSFYVSNPKFKTQTKEYFTGPAPEVCPTPEMFKIFKSWIACTAIKTSVEAREKNKIAKSQGAKKTNYVNIANVDDAIWAGSEKAGECVGFVCEGLSAKPFFTNGLKEVKDGRNRFGCYPLKGKVLNTKKATTTQILESDVVNDLVKFYGLDERLDYSEERNRKKLRYGQARIMADADVDGIHIKTLMINFFSRYKGLLESGFVTARLTPVITMTKNKDKRRFFSMSEMEKWKQKTTDWEKWKPHYFKGLGSATPDMIKDSFSSPVDQKFQCSQSDQDVLELAMGADSADERKKMYRLLVGLTEDQRLDSRKVSTIEDVIYEELIQFAIEANKRAIPSHIDGFKNSFRQIIYTALNKKGSDFEGVEEFQGVVKNLTHYKHGPESMKKAIIGMAQAFPGSNNIPLLEGEGNFGSRIGLGKDASAARYISCRPSPILRKIIRPEDDVMLQIEKEGKDVIGVYHYYPILPPNAFNRGKGTGWGWSTDCPNYNPMQLIDWVKYFVQNVKDGEPDMFKAPPLIPWWRGYKGILFRRRDGKLVTRGYFEMKGTTCYILDLPITTSEVKYQTFLDKLVDTKKIQGYKKISTDSNRPQFSLYGCVTEYKRHRDLNLESPVTETNIVFLDEGNLPKHYAYGICHVMMEWCKMRYSMYVRRKELYVKKMEEELRVTLLRMAFVEDVIADPPRFDIRSKSDEYIMSFMKANGYPTDFLSMSLRSLSAAKVEELRRKCQVLRDEIERYKSTHPGDLWLTELEELKIELERMYPGEWGFYPGYGTKEMRRPE